MSKRADRVFLTVLAIVAVAYLAVAARAVAAPPPPAGILAGVKPSSSGYRVVQGHRFFCRQWNGAGRFALECVAVKTPPKS